MQIPKQELYIPLNQILEPDKEYIESAVKNYKENLKNAESYASSRRES